MKAYIEEKFDKRSLYIVGKCTLRSKEEESIGFLRKTKRKNNSLFIIRENNSVLEEFTKGSRFSSTGDF